MFAIEVSEPFRVFHPEKSIWKPTRNKCLELEIDDISHIYMYCSYVSGIVFFFSLVGVMLSSPFSLVWSAAANGLSWTLVYLFHTYKIAVLQNGGVFTVILINHLVFLSFKFASNFDKYCAIVNDLFDKKTLFVWWCINCVCTNRIG